MESKHGDSSSDAEDEKESEFKPSAMPEEHDLTSSVSSQLCDYLYMDDDLSDLIESYVASSADRFSDHEPEDDGGSEYSLEHHAMYNEYTELVEKNIETFAKGIGYSPRALIEALSEAKSSASDISSGENMATAITALTSFEEFVRMMRDFIKDGISPVVCPPLLDEDGELQFS